MFSLAECGMKFLFFALSRDFDETISDYEYLRLAYFGINASRHFFDSPIYRIQENLNLNFTFYKVSN